MDIHVYGLACTCTSATEANHLWYQQQQQQQKQITSGINNNNNNKEH